MGGDVGRSMEMKCGRQGECWEGDKSDAGSPP